MTYADVPDDYAQRLKAMTKAERGGEYVTATEAKDDLMRHGKLSNAQEARLHEHFDVIELVERLDKLDEIREAANDPRRVIPGGNGGSEDTTYRSPGDATRDSAMRLLDDVVRSKDLPE